MYKTHFTSEVTPELDGKTVFLAGWIHTIRDLGGKKFILLRDRSGLIQVVVSKDSAAYNSVSELTLESTVQVEGIVKSDKRAPSGVEVHALSIKPFSIAKSPLPLEVSGKVESDIETRLKERVLDLRRVEMTSVLNISSEVIRSFRNTLYSKRFIEVFTPKIIASATEGGAQLFPVIYFGREAFLAQSPQLYKELLAGSVERVFEIAPAWRAEESDTPYHLSEFISMDVEMAFADYHDVMELLEDLVTNMIDVVKTHCGKELAELKHELPNITKPFPKISYSEALEILRGKGFTIKFGDDIGTPEARILAEEVGTPFYFLVEWPSFTRPFYTKSIDSNPDLSESFDLMYKWIEIASGSTRNHNRKVLEENLRRKGLNPENFEFFLRWFDYGMPPHAGFGMGFARLMLFFTGLNNVKEAIPFPRDKKRLTP
ncbi:aspartate--tRNA(Asn) ligase [Sulfolobales archaeon HS-7]|nr:aspartate--tRNA(Asn) ligase [Sulfolobales archaeon HS-7]